MILPFADFIAVQTVQAPATLVLCESGITRSVTFAALVLRSLLGVGGAEALEKTLSACGRTRVHPPLVEFVERLPAIPGLLPEPLVREPEELPPNHRLWEGRG